MIIPLMRKRFVDELGWIGEDEMMDLTAIAQSSPGPIAVNASILVGYRVGGNPGAIAAVLGSVLPPLFIISVISLFYQAFRENIYVNGAMKGILCAAAAVIADVVIRMIRPYIQEKRIVPIFMTAAAFAAVRFFSVNIVAVILLYGLIGAAAALRKDRKEQAQEVKASS